MLATLRQRARLLKAQTLALYLAARHPATPAYVKLLAVLVTAYALSPIDLIPDFIPVLGYLDDLVLIPLGIALVVKLTPVAVMRECEERARAMTAQERPVNRWAAAVIVLIWVLLAVLAARWLAAVLGL